MMSVHRFLCSRKGCDEGVGTGKGGKNSKDGRGDGLEVMVEKFVGIGFRDEQRTSKCGEGVNAGRGKES